MAITEAECSSRFLDVRQAAKSAVISSWVSRRSRPCGSRSS